MLYLIGIGNLLIGTAYTCLGLLSAWEVASQYRQRGLSRFGLGFSLMAASCGPHHLVHGWCVLHDSTVSMPLLAVTLLGLPAGVIFCGLRLEAILGGRGDRTFVMSPPTLVALAVPLLAAVGLLAGWTAAAPPAPGPVFCTTLGLRVVTPAPQPGIHIASVVLLTNLCATLSYTMVGWYIAETQVRRYMTNQSWSLSGLSLAAVFPSCAAMHLIDALTSGPHEATLPFDLLGVPASIYFLWVVKRLHQDSVIDWNRRPLAGAAATPDRSSPWSGPTPSGH